MRFKEGDRVIGRHGEGVVKTSFTQTWEDEDFEWVVVIYEREAYPLVQVEQARHLERETKRFYIEGDMCPGSAGDVPVILAGPQGMIKNFTERMEDYFEAEYDPTRGDNYHVTLTVELQRGD